MTDYDFSQFSEFIYDKCGIKLSAHKKTMLTSRLNRRLRVLGKSSFKEYYNYVTSPIGEKNELVFLINEVSTNKTDFFREEDHFNFLTSNILPEFSRINRSRSQPFRVWSAGCSSGEEPYTIAMVMDEYKDTHPGFDFSVVATDISTKVLDIAKKGVYADERLVTIDARYKFKYMMRGKGKLKGLHRVVPELGRKIDFQRFNLLEKDFQLPQAPYDLIFCRNVIIYFDRETQIELFKKFHRVLKPNGYIFVGHSENLLGMEDKMKRIQSAVYQDMSTGLV